MLAHTPSLLLWLSTVGSGHSTNTGQYLGRQALTQAQPSRRAPPANPNAPLVGEPQWGSTSHHPKRDVPTPFVRVKGIHPLSSGSLMYSTPSPVAMGVNRSIASTLSPFPNTSPWEHYRWVHACMHAGESAAMMYELVTRKRRHNEGARDLPLNCNQDGTNGWHPHIIYKLVVFMHLSRTKYCMCRSVRQRTEVFQSSSTPRKFTWLR